MDKKTDNFSLKTINGELLYFAALIIFTLEEGILTTMFNPSRLFCMVVGVLVFLLLLVKMIWYDYYSVSELFFVGIVLSLSALAAIVCGYFSIVFVMMLVVNAKGIDFDKILKVHFVTVLLVLFLTYAAAMSGIIVDLKYLSGGLFDNEIHIRESFGVIYPTDFGAHIFYLMAEFLYLFRKRINAYFIIFGFFVTYMLYRFVYAKLDVACLALLCIGYIFLALPKSKELNEKREIVKKSKKMTFMGISGILSIPLGFLIMFTASKNFDPAKAFYVFIDEHFGSIYARLSLGYEGLKKWGIRPFGQKIEMIGGGGKDGTFDSSYNFLDCSYLYILIIYGLVYFLLVLLCFMVASYRFRYDSFFILTIIVIAISSCIDHHLASMSYNPFIFAFLASSVDAVDINYRKTAFLCESYLRS